MILRTFLALFSITQRGILGVPVVDVLKAEPEPPGVDFCVLPTEVNFGDGGRVKYIQDCESLQLFKIPIPAAGNQQVGIHPTVCCPAKNPNFETDICFPSDPWCPTYVEPEYPEYNNDQDYDTEEEEEEEGNKDEIVDQVDERQDDSSDRSQPSISGEILGRDSFFSESETNCEFLPNTTCTPISSCNMMEKLDLDPITLGQEAICSFDQATAQLMICCPSENLLQKPKLLPHPRYPVNNKPRDCEDLTNLCKRWSANGACALNKTFETSEKEPYLNPIFSRTMFEFNSKACMQSCNLCGTKGCVDEHEFCPKWTREGFCFRTPFFMAHTCRESCGTCGFLSTLSTDKQIYKGKSYSRISDPDFDCGRYKGFEYLKSIGLEVSDGRPGIDFNVTDSKEGQDETLIVATKEVSSIVDFRSETDDDDDEIILANAHANASTFCSASLIADKWMITAAHCFKFGKDIAEKQLQVIRSLIPALKELVEVKRIYVHPEYRFPELHSDIALIELGRRVEFKLDEFGDTPTCLDKGLDLPGKLVTVQGYGITLKDKGGTLLETNTTIIAMKDCVDKLDAHLKLKQRDKVVFCKALPEGVSDEQLCAVGVDKYDDFLGHSVTTAACKGDSGGPILLEDDEGIRNLVGLVSGSLSCSGKIPEWYTSIQYHRT
ncbi:uncharacterized protein LOC111715813 isoform X2 [Eurytemora carolleeae]|nr:uncharacterized protein LOC111715813 isoform X2 [Eurytemora carolleeae]|eukprot:XP_023346958.1 uncharacterized protein LOC111715813 isoform X2 [Eurytemora affinis]